MTGSEHHNSLRHIWTALLSASILFFGAAHAASPEFSVAGNDGGAFVNKSIRTTLQDYLDSKGWDRGENRKTSGSLFFVATGTGSISAPVGHPRYMASRANAFDKAFLSAKAEMVRFISESISKELKSTYQEGQPSASSEETANAGSTKTSNLLLAALSQALGEPQGAPKAALPSQVDQVISSEQFKKSVRSVARSRIAGMQAFKVFESKRREIGVIAIWSLKLKAMADAVYNGDPSQVPAEAPKKPLKAQIPQDTDVLMTTFGVMVRRDENGYPALIAFGQGVPISDRTRAQDAAYKKARLMATGELRSFLGEVVSVNDDVSQSESLKDLSDRTSEYKYDASYKEEMSSKAPSRTIKGIKTLKEWEAVHPLTGQKVMGVIVVWTPETARGAARLQSGMTAPSANGQRAEKRYSWDNKKAWEGMASQGAEGDTESF